jgi:tetratricopeptide (TPR) repeat protein
MHSTSLVRSLPWIVIAAAAGAAAAAAPHLMTRDARSAGTPQVAAPTAMAAPQTDADGLRRRIAEMEARLREHPADASAAVPLADALLRQARATTDSRPAGRAEAVLTAALKETPAAYDALRMLGAIYLSQHRFREALDVGRRARDQRPDDAWNYGVMGDALVELGDYDKAFEAFDRMASMRPSATAYARVAYGRELRGDLEGAIEAMQIADASTPAQDVEAHAWYASQLGELHLRSGHVSDADREYRRATFFYPNYPHAMIGLGKVRIARGDRDGALDLLLAQLKRTPTLDVAARVGDLYTARGDRHEAERYYQLAEDLAGPAFGQTEANLALFLADHDRKLDEAIAIARAVAANRDDIFTADALAWASYKAGRIGDAAAASRRAMRTRTRDERILSHAAAIAAAAGMRNRQG